MAGKQTQNQSETQEMRKRHLGLDLASGEIICSALTTG